MQKNKDLEDITLGFLYSILKKNDPAMALLLFESDDDEVKEIVRANSKVNQEGLISVSFQYGRYYSEGHDFSRPSNNCTTVREKFQQRCKDVSSNGSPSTYHIFNGRFGCIVTYKKE